MPDIHQPPRHTPAASAAGVCQACKDPRFKKNHKRFNLSHPGGLLQAMVFRAMCWPKSPLMGRACRFCVCLCLLRSQCQPSLLLWRRLLLRQPVAAL
jgi:hypothetical protein